MTIASEISRLQNAKAAIKAAIQEKGVDVDDSTKLDGYAEKIGMIETGGTAQETTGVISVAVAGGGTADSADFTCDFTATNVANGQTVVMRATKTAKQITVLPGTYTISASANGYMVDKSVNSVTVAAGQTASVTLTLANDSITLSQSSISASAQTGSSYSLDLKQYVTITRNGASVAASNATYTITSGSLPTGLSLSNGVITGTPTAEVTNQSVTVQVAYGHATSQSITLTMTTYEVWTITVSGTVPSQSWTTGEAITEIDLTDYITVTCNGNSRSKRGCTFTASSLPGGLTLVQYDSSNGGKLSGTPTTEGSGTITVTVSREHATSRTISISYTTAAGAVVPETIYVSGTAAVSNGAASGSYSTYTRYQSQPTFNNAPVYYCADVNRYLFRAGGMEDEGSYYSYDWVFKSNISNNGMDPEMVYGAGGVWGEVPYSNPGAAATDPSQATWKIYDQNEYMTRNATAAEVTVSTTAPGGDSGSTDSITVLFNNDSSHIFSGEYAWNSSANRYQMQTESNGDTVICTITQRTGYWELERSDYDGNEIKYTTSGGVDSIIGTHDWSGQGAVYSETYTITIAYAGSGSSDSSSSSESSSGSQGTDPLPSSIRIDVGVDTSATWTFSNGVLTAVQGNDDWGGSGYHNGLSYYDEIYFNPRHGCRYSFDNGTTWHDWIYETSSTLDIGSMFAHSGNLTLGNGTKISGRGTISFTSNQITVSDPSDSSARYTFSVALVDSGSSSSSSSGGSSDVPTTIVLTKQNNNSQTNEYEYYTLSGNTVNGHPEWTMQYTDSYSGNTSTKYLYVVQDIDSKYLWAIMNGYHPASLPTDSEWAEDIGKCAEFFMQTRSATQSGVPELPTAAFGWNSGMMNYDYTFVSIAEFNMPVHPTVITVTCGAAPSYNGVYNQYEYQGTPQTWNDAPVYYSSSSGKYLYLSLDTMEGGYYWLFKTSYNASGGNDVGKPYKDGYIMHSGQKYQLVTSLSPTWNDGMAGNSYTFSIVEGAQAIDSTCFVAGTKIRLADGTDKNVEDITYDDELLAWDFDSGCLSSAKPAWIKIEETEDEYLLSEFSNGTVLRTVGPEGMHHEAYDVDRQTFDYLDNLSGHHVVTAGGDVVECVSNSLVQEKVKFYNIITERHFNLYANGILTSCRLSKMYPVNDMVYVKPDEPRNTPSALPADIVARFRLDEQPETMDEYVEKFLSIGVDRQ